MLRLAGSVELARIIDLASARLSFKLEYDPEILRGVHVTLRVDEPVDDARLWALVNQLLSGRGLTSVRPPGDADVLRIVRREHAAEHARLQRHIDEGGAPGPGYVSVEYRAQHASPRSIAEAVKPLLSKQGGAASSVPEAGIVVISDLAHIVSQALAVAALVDAPSGQVRVESVPLRSISAAAAQTMVAQLIAKRDAVAGAVSPAGGAAGLRIPGDVVAGPDGTSLLVVAPEDRLAFWKQLIEQVDQSEPATTRAYSPAGFTAAEIVPLVTGVLSQEARASGPSTARQAVVASDPLTGTLLITATLDQHQLVEDTLARLEGLPPSARRPLRTFTLKHRNVREVIGIVERLVSVGMLDAAGADEAAAAPGSETAPDRAAAGESRLVPPPPRPSGATIAVEPADSPLLRGMTRGSRAVGGRGYQGGRSDALTLTADEATNTLIAVGEPRILAQLEKLLPTLDVRQPQVMIEAMLVSLSDSQTMQLGIELEKIEVSGGTLIRLASLFGLSSAGTGANAGSRTVGDAAGFSGVVLNPGDFSVVIRALETVNQGRSFSVPRVLVNNNQQATFNSSLQQPYASTNASDTVATTSFGGTFDAGTSITVRPQIAEGDHLVLDYQVTLSSFTGSATANLPPPRQENSVNSIATIPDGYTVVVGGLEAIADGEGESRVPGIGAIPIIGELFKNRTNQRSRTRFFVFLRANVMRGAAGTGFEELKYISDRAAGESGLSDEQSAGGWPELAPRIMR